MISIAEGLYSTSKKLGVFVVFWELMVFFLVFSQFFHSPFMVFEIGIIPSLFVVVIKPYFENHEKTMKKLRKDYQKNHQLPENHQKTNFCQKSTNFHLINVIWTQ